ncbi:hypothetical protein ABPG75_002718 [Micractinium tetrahymenae]
MAHRRIVIDFDDDGEGSAVSADDGAEAVAGSAALAAAAAAGTQGAVGTGSNKPADLLRSIQTMRMTLKRLEQQKQQHAAASAAPAAGYIFGGVSDKHVVLQLEMEQLRQEIEQKNSQLQRLPKPGMVRAATPSGPALAAASAAPAAASNAVAGPAHLNRSISLPSASGLAGGSVQRDLQPSQQQQQQQQHHIPSSKLQRLGKQRSDAHSPMQPAKRPALQQQPGRPSSAGQQQEQHNETPSPGPPRPEWGMPVGCSAANGAAGHEASAREAAEGHPVALLPSGLLQVLLPAERRPAAAAELSSIRARKQQVLLKRQVLQQLLQDAMQAWDQLCLQERQLLQQAGLEVQPQAEEAAVALPTSAPDAAGLRRQQRLAALAAAAADRTGAALPAAGEVHHGSRCAALLAEPCGAGQAPTAGVPPAVPTPEVDAAGPAVPAPAVADVPAGQSKQQGGAEGQQEGVLLQVRASAEQQLLAASGHKRARSRSRSEGRGRQGAAQRQRRLCPPPSSTSTSSTSDGSTSGGSSLSDTTSASTSGNGSGSTTSSSTSSDALPRRTPRGRPGSGAGVRRKSRSGSRGHGTRRSSSRAAERGRQRSRSRERSRPQPRPLARRSPTPDAAPRVAAASGGSGARQQEVLLGAAAAVDQSSRKPEGGATKAAGAHRDGGGSRSPLHISDSLRRLFLLGLRRCCKLWHLPFSAYRIEGQMEHLQRGFVCRHELGAPFSKLLQAMQCEGHLKLDMSDASSSRWRVTAVPGSAAAADRERPGPGAAAPPAAKPSDKQAAAAAQPAAAIAVGAGLEVAAQPTGAGAAQLPAPAARPALPAADRHRQPPAAAGAAAAAAAAGTLGSAAEDQPTSLRQQHTAPHQAANAHPNLRLQSKGPAARSLLAAAAAAAGSIQAAAAATDVARTSAAFKYAAAEVQQQRLAQNLAHPTQQPQHGEAHQPVRVVFLVGSTPASPGGEHVRLLITPQVPPAPVALSRPSSQASAQRSQQSSAPPPPVPPPVAPAAPASPSAMGVAYAQRGVGVPPWVHPAQAPTQQQHWQRAQQPRQHLVGQPLPPRQQEPQGQAAALQQSPARQASNGQHRQLSSYADLAPGEAVASGQTRGAGRHLPVFSSSDAGRPTRGAQAGAGRGLTSLGPGPLLPWLQGLRRPEVQVPPAHASLLAQLEGCLQARTRGSTATSTSSCSSIFDSGGLLSKAVAGVVLHPPAVGGTTSGSVGAQPGMAPASGSATKPAPLLADWPICPYELRGSCRDAACRCQLQRLLEQQQAAFAAKAASTQGPALLLPAATQPQPKRQRVPDATVQGVALEQQLPLYGVSKQWCAGLGSSSSGNASASRAGRPFTSLLLAPAGLLEPAPAAAGSATRSLSAALRWQLLPGGGAVSGHMLHCQQQQAADPRQELQMAQPDSGRRYFSREASSVQQGHEQEGAEPYWQRQYEELLQQRPENDELWLSYAVRHAVEKVGGNDCALTFGMREQVLLVLKRGLEHNRHSAVLWPLYLHLYCQQPGCAAGMMVDTALQFAPHSYRLWLVAAEQQQQWQEAAAMLQRGVLALCKPAPTVDGVAGVAGVSSGPLPEAQAAAALDLGLRLLQLLSMADQQDSRVQLVQWAGADLPSTGSLLQRGKAALLAELQPHPRLLAVLCCCCAYAAVHGSLPIAAQHSLGYQQTGLSELLRGWPGMPEQGEQQPQAAGDADAACRAALIACADSLGLLGRSGSNLLHQERGLAPSQHARMLDGLRQAQQAQPEALLAAQSGLLLAMLRLDSRAGSAGTPGSSLLAQLVESISGMPGGGACSLAPPQLAALAVTQQRWQAFATWADAKQQQQQQQGPRVVGMPQGSGQQEDQHGGAAQQQERSMPAQPPAELVLLLQEAVLAAAVAVPAAAAQSGGSNPLLRACLQGRLHPAAAAALAAAIASSGCPQAASATLEMLSHWAVAYEAGDPRQAWPCPAQPLDVMLAGGGTSPVVDEQLEAVAAAALQRLTGRQHSTDPRGALQRSPGPAAGDAAATLYCCWMAVLHKLLQPPPPSDAQHGLGLPALHTAALAWSADGQPGHHLGQLEAAALSLLAAAAQGDATNAATVQRALSGGRRQQALLWPLPRQHPDWPDPLAAAALAPPAASVPCLPPPPLVRQLPLRLQVLVLESLLPTCSPAVAAAAAVAALQAAEAAAASQTTSVGQLQGEQQAALWRHPVLGWALPLAASALASSIPAAAPELWHQVVALAAAVSPLAGAELSAVATAVHPFSLRLWQQRHRLLSAAPPAPGGQKPAMVTQEAQQRGLALPPPWQHHPEAIWGASLP